MNRNRKHYRCQSYMSGPKAVILFILFTAFITTQSGVSYPDRRNRNPGGGTASVLDSITPETVKPIVVKLSGDEYEGRGAGYEGERKAAKFIADEFKKIGLDPVGDRTASGRGYFQEFKFNPHHPVIPWEMLTSRNVLGFVEGTDPVLKQEIVVIGAHYDGQGRLGQADPFRGMPVDPLDKGDSIWHSANDNLTGVSAVLAAARAIKLGNVQTKRSILFIAFGCEEHGQSGSIAYVTHPSFELKRHVAMINYEKLGRAPDRPLIAGSTGTSSAWKEVLEEATAKTGTQVKTPIPFVIPDSDHYPFAATGIPAVVFSVNGPDDAHLPADVAEKIDYARVAEYARYGLAILLELADRPSRPAYVNVRGLDPGMIAHLAADEECDRVGVKAPDSGLKVTGIIPGGAADRAGVRSGDLILKGADLSFRRDMTLQILQRMQMEIATGQRGVQLPVTILRDGKQIQLTIDLRSG